MHKVSLLQIGDVHFPEARKESTADLKDKAIPTPLVGEFASPKLQRVLEHALRVIGEQKTCGVLICGDLTSKGDLPQYGECVAYIRDLLDLSNRDRAQWHAVPGNHDVERSALAPGERPYPESFIPLQKAWTDSVAFDPLPITHYRHSMLPKADSGLAVYSLNSCVGCGEWRRLSSKLQGSLTGSISKLLAEEKDPDERFALVSEQLDSPLFRDADLTSLQSAISQLPPTSVPVILTHHNLLPQETPRADIYGELLNGGSFRGRLCALNRTVLYCHGHIHQDPIDVISSVRFARSQIVSISAPELKLGFNLLTVYFSSRWEPLGLEVAPYRYHPYGDVLKEQTYRVPFVTAQQLPQRSELKPAKVLHACTREQLPLSNVRERLRPPKMSVKKLSEVVRELEWYGVVQIENRDATRPIDLRVRRTTP